MSDDLREQDIDQLNSFLRGEISAVETYEKGLEAAEQPRVSEVLQKNRDSHQERARFLTQQVRQLGGEPAEGSGVVWGAFAKAVAGGAKLFGESAAVAALEEGEDHGLKDYEGDLSELSPAARALVASTLLPEQKRTHDSLAALKKSLDA